jgi:GTP-binding protein LepA
VIVSCAFKTKFDVFEVGILNPEYTPLPSLGIGQVGYVMTNMKYAKDARIGDTFKLITSEVEAEAGF